MKLVTFNVNGIRAVLKKDFDVSFADLDPDVMVLEETKLSDPDAPFPFLPEGYEVYWTISKVRKGYSGTAVLTRVHPLSVHYGLENGEYDEEGRVITLEFDSFYLVGAYVPNAGDGLKRLDFRMGYEDKLLPYLKALEKKKPVVYTGDLNVAHMPIDLEHPESNEGNPGYTPQERAKMNRLLDAGFIDSFRHLYPDTVKYSWWSYRMRARERNVGWRIDYFLISPSLLPNLKDCVIRNDIFGSDHCPVELFLDI